MLRSLVRFSESEVSNRTPSLADFITITSGFKLSVHTGHRAAVRALLLAGTCLAATPSFAQTFVAQGAAPGNGFGVTDPGSFQTFTGATSAVLPDPNFAGNLIIGSVNGGIWTTTNANTSDGNVTWTARTDNQLSLSIAALALDPTNTQNLIAGVGPISNGAMTSGPLVGIMISNNGGKDWTTRAVDGAAKLGITAAARVGDTLLVGSSDLSNGSSPGGLFRSTGGNAFQTITLPNSDAIAPVTGIVRGTSATKDVFIAAGGGITSKAPTIYMGTIDGNSWTTLDAPGSALATDLATQSVNVKNDPALHYDSVVRLASGPSGTIAAAVAKVLLVNGDTKATLSSIYLSNDSGSNWTKLSIAGLQINTGGQALTDLSIAVDPTDKKTVYVAGDTSATATNKAGNFYLPIFKLTLNADNSTAVTDLSILGANNSFVHPDVRGIAFDKNNQLIVLTDAGIHILVNGVWHGLNGNLQLGEYYQVSYDSRNKRVGAAAQDNGVQLQLAANAGAFALVGGGDGINISFADRNGANTYLYGSQQQLALFRGTIDSTTGKLGDLTYLRLFDGATQINPGDEGNPNAAPFSSKFVLNRFNQNQFVVGTKAVYAGVDTPSDPGTGPADNRTFDIDVTKVGDAGANTEISALAYGVNGNTQAILAGSNLAGSDKGKIWLAPDGTSGTWTEKTDYRTQGGLAPTSVVFDARTIKRFYAADGTSVWETKNTGTNFSNLSASLPTYFISPRALEFISQNGVNALVIGGLNSADNLGNPIVTASSKIVDGTLYDWRRLGSGMPNAPVFSLYYSAQADALVAGTFGRGAWTLYDVTSFFPQAWALWFGKADNDSTPVVSQLSNGVDENGVGFSRGLMKYGTGTLTISAGLASAYKGSTAVTAGILVVDGSIVSSSNVAVNAGGTLSGTGTVPVTVVASGASLSPGNANNVTGTLSVQGNLTLAAGSNYYAQFLGANASKTAVTGTVVVGGNLFATGFGGIYALRTPYTVLSATTAVNGKFSAITGNGLGATRPRATYDANNVFIVLDANMLATLQQLSPSDNQKKVAAALDNGINNSASVPGAFNTLYSLPVSSLLTALTQLAGTTPGGAATAGMQLMNSFLSLSLNPFSGAPNGNVGAGGGGRSFAADQEISPEAAAAYAAVTPKERAKPVNPVVERWGLWGAAYGGNSSVNGNTAVGTADTTAKSYGVAAGADYRATADTLLGFVLGGGGTSWSLSSGLGGGRGDTFQIGVYGSHYFGAAYVSAALADAWHAMTTDRTVTAVGTEQMRASFNANSVGGRLETGYRFATPFVGITPYGALQAQNFRTPAYSESVVSGTGAFALSYSSRNSVATRTELGAWFDKAKALGPTTVLALRARLAWAHDHSNDPAIGAVFQMLPGSNFVVNATTAPADLALLTAGGEIRFANNISIGAKFDGEFARGAQTYSGSGSVRYVW